MGAAQGADRDLMPEPRGDGRWLVTGAGGMLGHDVVAALEGRDVYALTRARLDITRYDDVMDALTGNDIVVNTAAWTDVDGAESDEAGAFAVNATGAANLARACAITGTWLVQLSTDYVFAGDASQPYATDSVIDPRSAYGRTKAAGEWAVRSYALDTHHIVRTAWLYGAHGPSFVRTMDRLAGERDTVEVVDDQTGQPTWTVDVAARIVALVDAGAPPGTYHATGSGSTTWYGLARRVFELGGHDPDRVLPTTSSAFVRPAPRPAYSVLGDDACLELGMPTMPPWETALADAWPSLVPNGGR